MASLRPENYVVILVPVGSASAGDIQFVMQREAISGKVWSPTGGIFHQMRNTPIRASIGVYVLRI
jgi:hypothetical protein